MKKCKKGILSALSLLLMACVLQVFCGCIKFAKPARGYAYLFEEVGTLDKAKNERLINELTSQLDNISNLSKLQRGTTVLHAAVTNAIEKGDPFSVKQLEVVLNCIEKRIGEGAKKGVKYPKEFPSLVDKSKYTPFGIAFFAKARNKTNSDEVFKSLMSKSFIDVNKVSDSQQTSLFMAIDQEFPEVAKILLDHDKIKLDYVVDENANEHAGYTLLHLMIVKGLGSQNIETKLIDKFLDTSHPSAKEHKNLLIKKDKDGMIPAALAVYYKNVSVFKQLLPKVIKTTKSTTTDVTSELDKDSLFKILFQAKENKNYIEANENKDYKTNRSNKNNRSNPYYSLFALAYLKRSNMSVLALSFVL